MKKFYCNGKIVYMHNDHNSLSAKIILKELGIASEFDNVCQALDEDQDMLDVPGPGFSEVVRESEVCNCGFPEQDPVEKALDDLDGFFVDMLGDEDYDHYVLPNGKSAPYGLTGVELATMRRDAAVYIVSLLHPGSFVCDVKGHFTEDVLLVAVDRDLIFATREKAVEAYNALFGDLYGTV